MGQDGAEQTVTEYIDQALEEAGGAGRLQLFYVIALNLAWAYIAMLIYFPIFAGEEATQQLVECAEGSKNNSTACVLKDVNCTLPRRSWEFVDVEGTYVAEFALICDRSYMAPLLSTAFFFGFMFGVLVWGAISDSFGRRIAFFVPLVLSLIGAALSVVAPSYWPFAFARCLMGFGSSGFCLTAFVWCTEFLGKDLRSVMGWLPSTVFSIGQIALSPLGVALADWRDLALALAILGLCFLGLFPCLHESPRWLASKGRLRDAHEVLCRVATCNGRTISSVPETSISSCGAATSNASGLQLLDPRLRFRSVVMCTSWFAMGMAYYGLSLNAASLPLDAFWANAVGGLSCIPAYIIAKFLIDWPPCGRRWAIGGSLLICGVCLLMTAVAGQTMMLVLYYVSESAVSLAFSVVYVYASELFPTSIGGTAMGIQSLCARVGSMVAPFIATFGSISPALPQILFGIPCLFAGVLILCLPETLGQPVPGTIDDVGTVAVEDVELKSARL